MLANRKLIGHSSCVNALAFSSGEGRWLASAGDGKSLLPYWHRYKWSPSSHIDRVVKLWDLHQEDVSVPSCSFTGPGVST
jgi:WD repeat-containing protein 22